MSSARSFNSGNNAPPYHMAVKKLVEMSRGSGFESWTEILFESVYSFNSYLSSNMRSRNTLAKIVWA